MIICAVEIAGLILRLIKATSRNAHTGHSLSPAKGYSTSPLRILFLLLLLTPFAGNIVAAAPRLTADSQISTAGYYRLSWTSDTADKFILQENVTPSFGSPRTLYTGLDTATVISGKSTGTYFYRVGARSESGRTEWSEITRVEVAHHSLSRALLFFVTGFIVFIAILLVIIRGNGSSSHG
jgi:hypothetical protein